MRTLNQRWTWYRGVPAPWSLSASIFTLRVGLPRSLELVNTLTRFIDPGAPGVPPQLDLSKARRLKDIEFRFESPNVQWIVATLQTARLKHLRQIVIFSSATTSAIEEMDRREWQDLDNLLVRLWTSYSVTPAIKYQRGMDLGELASSLLPELTEKGIICEVGEDWRSEW